MNLSVDPRKWLPSIRQLLGHKEALPQSPQLPQLSRYFELDPARAGAIQDRELRSRLLDVPRLVYDWAGPHLDLSRASILDFGCGLGTLALGMALQLRPRRVVGVDIHSQFDTLAEVARTQLGVELPACLELRCVAPDQPLAANPESEFDLVFAWDAFEHVDRKLADKVVDTLAQSLRPGGFCLIGVTPLFYSPFGSHLASLIGRPWAHLTEQYNHLEAEAQAERQRLVASGDEERQRWLDSVWGCYTTLNKFTGDDLVDLFARHGFRVLREHRTDCEAIPPLALTRIYNERVLKNEQIMLLLRKS